MWDSKCTRFPGRPACFRGRALAGMPKAAATAAAAVVVSSSLRFIVSSLSGVAGSEATPRRLVEEMQAGRIGAERDGLAGTSHEPRRQARDQGRPGDVE